MNTSLDQIEARLVAACRELRPQYPGAFEGYYDRLLDQGRMLTDADRVIVEYVEQHFPDDTRFCEICAGIGQLSSCLSALGYFTHQIEDSEERMQVALELIKRVGGDCSLDRGRWQECDRIMCRADVIICTNAVSQSVVADDAEILDNLLDEGFRVIWQPSLFGVEGAPLLEAEADEIATGVWHQWK